MYGNPANNTDPSGHCIEDACLLELTALGFIIGFLTNVGANALQRDDAWGYLLSQEAGVDLLVGGAYGASAAFVGSGLAIIGPAYGLSTGGILLTEAVSLGVLNVGQGEASTYAKHVLLGYEQVHSTLDEVATNFVYGFASPFLAYGGAQGVKWFSSKIFGAAIHSQYPWISEFAYDIHRSIRTWKLFRSLKTPEEIAAWDKEADDFVTGSFARMLGMVGYGHTLVTNFSYRNIFANSNLLPYMTSRAISVWDPLNP